MADKNDRTPEKEAPARPEAIEELLRLAGPRPPVAEDRTARVRAAVHRHWRESLEKNRPAFWTPWRLGIAAAATLILAVTLTWWQPWDLLSVRGPLVATLVRVEGTVRGIDGQPLMGIELLDAHSVLETGPAGRAALHLTGGAEVRLDHETSLRVISATALQLERGAVYVDSGLDAVESTSLEVRTRIGTVVDVGTQFEVRVDPSQVQVKVRDGLARLDWKGKSYPAEKGIHLTVTEMGTVSRQEIPLTGEAWDWTQEIVPPFELEGKTLEEFLDWVQVQTGLEIRYQDSSIAQDASSIRLHGTVAGLRPDEAPAAVLPTCGLTEHRENGFLVLDRVRRD